MSEDGDPAWQFEEPPAFEAADVARLASRYLTRYAASSHHLRRVLDRQIRRWHERRRVPRPEPAKMAALIDAELFRLTKLGLLNDDAFAIARARRLVGKGLPGDQVRRRLAAEHLDPRLEGLDDVIVEDAETQARRLAKRKRLGPFRTGPREPYRDKDIRGLVRAGFPFRVAVAIVDGSTEEGDTIA